MPPIKKYHTALPPSPCTDEMKNALETAADVISEKTGNVVKPAALLRQIVVEWLSINGFIPADVSEFEDLKAFEFSKKISG